MQRDEVIQRIRHALKARSGMPWSVTGGRGTAWGWINIDAPPARRTWKFVLPAGVPDVPESYVEVDTGTPGGHTGPEDREILRQLLGLSRMHWQGESIPSSTDYYEEYVDRAEGRMPKRYGAPYWD